MPDHQKRARGRPFVKGQSGNPNGRPPGSGNVKTALSRELDGRITIKEGGRERVLTRREVIVKRAVQEAMSGSGRHMAFVFANDPASTELLGESVGLFRQPADEAARASLLVRLRNGTPVLTRDGQEADSGDGRETDR